MKKAKLLSWLIKSIGEKTGMVRDKPVIMKGIVKAKVLNVRSMDNKTSDIVGKLRKAELVEIISIGAHWYEINFNHASAFVAAKYIKPKIKRGRVTANVLNVRSLPSIESDVVGKLKKEKKIIILDILNGWYKILFDRTFAYVSVKYVELDAKKSKEYLFMVPELQRIAIAPNKKLPVEGNHTQKVIREIYNEYGSLLKSLSKKLKIDLASAVAVIGVESGGIGIENGRTLIRFENHLFYRYWGKNNMPIFKDHFSFDQDKKWLGHMFKADVNKDWEKFHGDQEKEYMVFEFAKKLNEDAALISISMGLPQIIGSNCKLIGYDNPTQMFMNFNNDIRYQIFGLFDFLNPRMLKYLRNKEFVNFARYYNGAGQARRYGKWLQDYFESFPEELVT